MVHLVLIATAAVLAASTAATLPTNTQRYIPDFYRDMEYDDSSEDSSYYDFYSEETEDPRLWRAEKFNSMRGLVIPKPVPPTPPNLMELEAIRKDLRGKTLKDTIYVSTSSGSSSSSASSFISAASTSSDSSSKKLHRVICHMDCPAVRPRHAASFRGKDSAASEEARLKRVWETMTDIEKQFIESITNENATRRSNSYYTTFQVFSNWCTKNCFTQELKPMKGRHKTVMYDEDYGSDEFISNRRAADDTDAPVKGTPMSLSISHTVHIPMKDIMETIFGREAVAALKAPTICLCGSPAQKCSCKASQENRPLFTLPPKSQ